MTSAGARGRLPGHVTAIAVTLLVSCLEDGLAITALMLDFHDRGTGGFGIAALFGAMSVPAIVLAGLVGRISDRYPARRVLSPLGVALVAVCAQMATAHAVALLIAMFAVLSGLMAIAAPVFVKVLLQAAPGPLMSRAGALVSMASSLGFLRGPGVGALLMDAIGLRGVLLMDAVTYLSVPVVALFLPAPTDTATPSNSAQPDQESGFLVGLRVLAAPSAGTHGAHRAGTQLRPAGHQRRGDLPRTRLLRRQRNGLRAGDNSMGSGADRRGRNRRTLVC
ncbi:MFS transporter [Streptomyces sp. NPDC086549]|uniref:MFS transporter n=1 Tax=Streptomyces sp. NPDC086549 TaxID=3365752 RepID=UPI0038062F86